VLSNSNKRLKNILALIPARGGSKGVPGKNIKKLKGIPLIGHSIAVANSVSSISRTIVSTDDEEIATISKDLGAEVPFLRPSHLATDHSLDFDVFLHALNWLSENESYTPDLIIHLRPTCPFRKPTIIEQAIHLMLDKPNYDSLRSVSVSPKTPYKMWSMNGDCLSPILSLDSCLEPYNQPRQKLPTVYWQNGYVDITKPHTIQTLNMMCGHKILPFLMQGTIVDIDTYDDFVFAENVTIDTLDTALLK
jgi:CMP-N,N'-diacetyllegionaminic acid synthase